jgi:DNA-binding NarL/FixJ family response regulator
MGLSTIIDNTEGMQVKSMASSYAELLVLLKKGLYDLLILDLNLGDKNGLKTLESITDMFSDLAILVLSASPEEQYAVPALKIGAAGYLNKNVFSLELVKAIGKINRGTKYISESLSEKLTYGLSLDKGSHNTTEVLSKRELEVLSLIGSGMTYKEIAVELVLSPKTISTYRKRILEKLGLTRTAQLLRYACEHNISMSKIN